MNASLKVFIFLNINLKIWLMAEVQIDGELFDHPVEVLKPEDAFMNRPALRQNSPTTTKTTRTHPTTKPPYRTIFHDDCANYAYVCLRAYDTGAVCGRALHYQYKTFKNYCMMDYTNCVHRYVMWQNYHMGECYDFKYSPSFDVWLPIHGTTKTFQDEQPTTHDYRRVLDTRPEGQYRYVHHTSTKYTAETLYTSRKWHPAKTAVRHMFKEECDYLAYYCLKAFDTGVLCARSMYYNKHVTFKNFCMMDYANCMERYEVWFPIYSGNCEEVHPARGLEHYHYQDDFFLDQIFAIEK